MISCLDEDMDEDELEMCNRKLKKKLVDLHLKDQSILHIQDTCEGEDSQRNTYLQIIENPNLE